jgi:Leucine-rich repeat (LRR) protein
LQIETLPEEFATLGNLKELNLSNNHLQEMPNILVMLTQLVKLDLSKNQLTTLPANTSQLSQLSKLDMSHNRFSTLPVVLPKLKRLVMLDLSDNSDLQSYDETMSLMESIKYINLRHTRFNAFQLDHLSELLTMSNVVY